MNNDHDDELQPVFFTLFFVLPLCPKIDTPLQKCSRKTKDKNRFEALLIASSRVDIPDLEFGTPEMFPVNAVDRLTMFTVNRKHEDVSLKVEADVQHDRIGINNMVNILGKKFGLRRE